MIAKLLHEGETRQALKNIIKYNTVAKEYLNSIDNPRLLQAISNLGIIDITDPDAYQHFMNEFVDKDGTVFHKGVEQPKLKGTLKPTKVVPKKKTKRRTKEQILIAREAEKKAALKKAVQKQKDFLNHKFGD